LDVGKKLTASSFRQTPEKKMEVEKQHLKGCPREKK
jgi:hypothetical protein